MRPKIAKKPLFEAKPGLPDLDFERLISHVSEEPWACPGAHL